MQPFWSVQDPAGPQRTEWGLISMQESWGILEWSFWQIIIRSIVEIALGPKFTNLHSSQKERQLQKRCFSFLEECILPTFAITGMNHESTENITSRRGYPNITHSYDSKSIHYDSTKYTVIESRQKMSIYIQLLVYLDLISGRSLIPVHCCMPVDSGLQETLSQMSFTGKM